MELLTRRIPDRLMPDDNYQFLVCKPYGLVYDLKPDESVHDLDNIALVQPRLDQWFIYDSWDIKLACKLITIGYPVYLERRTEEVKDWPEGCEGLDSFRAMVTVYNRAFSIANTSVKAGTIKEHDTPANWRAWAEGKGYSVAHLMPVDTTRPADDNPAEAPTANNDPDKELADLFDPVTVETLEQMFPADSKWQRWAGKASENNLKEAREYRAMFNPYKAAMWFLTKGIKGWDLARCNRVLEKNLPARSKDEAYKITGNLP